MIKKILVALDLDLDTPVATRYAIEIARRYNASITGLAVVDTEHIASESRGGGIGSMYYAEKMRKGLTQETRQRAQELLHEFGESVKDKDVKFVEHIKEGVPYEQIVDEMKYHDLFIVGKDPHFFYGHPKQRTQTLARVVKAIIGPALVVGEEYRTVDRVLVAYDGSPASARTMRRFVHHQPFGTGMKIDVLNIYGSGGATASELLLRQALEYMQSHGFDAQPISRGGDHPGEEIVAYARAIDADLIVAGSHSVSKVSKMFFGSTTASLLDDIPVALYLDS